MKFLTDIKAGFASTFSPYITYSRHIFKFWVNQITMSALGALVSCAIYLTNGIPLLQFILACFPIGFFCFLIYDMMFTFGNKDSVSIEYEKMEFDKLFGLRIFAFSFAPSLLAIITTTFLTVMKVADAPAVTSVIYYILNAYNLGMFWVLGDFIQPLILMYIMMIPPMFFCFLGYYLGAKDKPIRKLLGIPMNTKKK